MYSVLPRAPENVTDTLFAAVRCAAITSEDSHASAVNSTVSAASRWLPVSVSSYSLPAMNVTGVNASTDFSDTFTPRKTFHTLLTRAHSTLSSTTPPPMTTSLAYSNSAPIIEPTAVSHCFALTMSGVTKRTSVLLASDT